MCLFKYADENKKAKEINKSINKNTKKSAHCKKSPIWKEINETQNESKTE